MSRAAQHSPSLEVNKCVPRFDHHCPWVGNTIGYKNHPIFVAYTISVFVCLTVGMHTQLEFLSDAHQHHGGYSSYPWVILSIGICVVFAIFSFVLFLSQLFTAVLGNLTTNESVNRSRYSHFINHSTGNPFNRGRLANIRMFFHFTATDEALCLQCDEPEVEMAA